jgi:hypothetical protein
MAKSRGRFLFAVAVITAILVGACNALLDFEAYKVQGDAGFIDTGSTSGVVEAGVDAGDGGCIDPTGFGGRGCYKCTPTTNEQLLNACTPAKFEVFDNVTRIKNFDPNNPRPTLSWPYPDGGPPNPPNFIPPSTSSSSGGPSDAGCPFGDTTNYPNPVLVMGATGFPMETLAKAMGSEATIYFSPQSSCLGVGGAVKNNPKMGGPKTPAASYLQVTYYNKNANPVVPISCRMEADMAPDITLSGLYVDSCANTPLNDGDNLGPTPALNGGWTDYFGLVNPAMFATVPSSTQRVISAEAAYRVYGFGSIAGDPLAAGVEPWIDEKLIFRRTGSSATQQAIARTLFIGIDGLRGVNATGSTAMRQALVAASDPQRAIGISTSEIVDVDRDAMKSLAYQHWKQPVGFYPDSEPNLLDRRNVRDGHYFLWVPLHVFVNTQAGDPIAAANPELEMIAQVDRAARNKAVKALAYVMANRQEAPVKGIDLFGALKRLGNVPPCAMRVTRAKEGADLTVAIPPQSCACAFEAAAPASAGLDCKPCTGPADCNGTGKPTCSFGFCE